MSKLSKLYTIMLGAVIFLAAPLAHAEVIRSFSSDVTLHKDSRLEVVERILYDFGSEERHGIFRTIPTTHPDAASVWYRERYMTLEDVNVMRDGKTEQFAVERINGEEDTIRVGSPDITTSGMHEYVIRYVVRGALSYPRDTYPEVHWNATGNDWEVPILYADATLYDPDGILRAERSCYRGIDGSTASCLIAATTTGIKFSTTNLAPGEGITFANAIEIAKVENNVLEKTNWMILGPAGISIALVIVAIALAYTAYRYRTKHKLSLPIVAQYEPYTGMLPMYTGVLVDGKLDPRDITAAIIDLAEQGFLKITKTERTSFFFFELDDFEIEILKILPVSAPQFSKDVLSLISAYPDPGTVIALSELAQNATHARANLETIERLRSDAVQDLTTRGFYEFIFALKDMPFTKWPAFLVKPGLIAAGMVFLFMSGLILVVVVGSAVLAALIPWNLRRLTRKGYKAVNHLEGYKLYLSVAEKDRINFHNAPEKSPAEFLSHLPYAIAFGVEEKWAKAFEDITIPTPDWYSGGQGAAFDAASLGKSFGAFSTAFTSSAGTSSSSGGGLSGGGAGGGGGGSW